MDRTLFWASEDLETKLREFQKFFQWDLTHAGLRGRLPGSGGPASPISFCFVLLAEARLWVVPDADCPVSL